MGRQESAGGWQECSAGSARKLAATRRQIGCPTAGKRLVLGNGGLQRGNGCELGALCATVGAYLVLQRGDLGYDSVDFLLLRRSYFLRRSGSGIGQLFGCRLRAFSPSATNKPYCLARAP